MLDYPYHCKMENMVPQVWWQGPTRGSKHLVKRNNLLKTSQVVFIENFLVTATFLILGLSGLSAPTPSLAVRVYNPARMAPCAIRKDNEKGKPNQKNTIFIFFWFLVKGQVNKHGDPSGFNRFCYRLGKRWTLMQRLGWSFLHLVT